MLGRLLRWMAGGALALLLLLPLAGTHSRLDEDRLNHSGAARSTAIPGTVSGPSHHSRDGMWTADTSPFDAGSAPRGPETMRDRGATIEGPSSRPSRSDATGHTATRPHDPPHLHTFALLI